MSCQVVRLCNQMEEAFLTWPWLGLLGSAKRESFWRKFRYEKKKKKEEGGFLNSYPVVLGKSLPLRVQVILGVGLPRAAHFNETSGPGCMV